MLIRVLFSVIIYSDVCYNVCSCCNIKCNRIMSVYWQKDGDNGDDLNRVWIPRVKDGKRNTRGEGDGEEGK